MIVQTIPIPASRTISVSPLTREAFAPFGTAIANPRPEALPSNTSPQSIAAGSLPYGAVSANQGSAIQYRGLAAMQNLYSSSSSSTHEKNAATAAATPRMTMFVCGARDLGRDSVFRVGVLERHPFTSQTFIPLTADASKRYLVIVAPTLPASSEDTANLPAPPAAAEEQQQQQQQPRLPGPGLPDLTRLVAFIATGEQAVTYAAGTWHAPMVALGPAGSAIDFVVVQFANDVPIEDCQEVELSGAGGSGDEERKLVVQVPSPGRGGLAAKL
ncbi:ureidoglycolate hydrolase [Microdochium trichocladiopsis]|uniref:Ureidoglycolate hydrolase n=1 Tax=Microdochium trichocladiopsis TaxID=1682393 RepID=A0A9P8Y1K3_9PEZI|nr:ureidoglycolate hydrolase [Microdochium trichocladiopsis]KAH7025889.1 ureidoglycolate hydrolase [Microdochium trichocladiopsis]